MAQILYINDDYRKAEERRAALPVNHDTLESLTAELVTRWRYWDIEEDGWVRPPYTEHLFGMCYTRATLDLDSEEFHVTIYYGTMDKLKPAARVVITKTMLEEYDE